jgi:predicted phage terminase large subunit-like protein
MKLTDADIVEQLAIAEARWSFYAFRQYINPKLKLGWWQRESAYELQRFYESLVAGERPKLIIEAPPQHGKSLLIIDFDAWLAGHHPDYRTIYTSFSERLGVRANLRLQRLFATEKYKKVFPDTKLGGTVNRDLLEFEDKDGYFRNTTVRGSITGEGLDLGIIDDPIKGREQARSATVRDATWDWLTDDFMTRFADDAGLLIILTRWHIDDPVGRLKEVDPSIRCVSHPAIATEDEPFRKKGEALFPEHKSLEFLQGIKKIMATSSWESLYQQRPFVEDGEFFHPDMMPIVEAIPTGIQQTTRAWDLAATEGGGDWTVGFKLGKLPDGRCIILDLVRFQRGPDKVRASLKNTADLDGRTVKIRGPQDPGQAGKDQAQQLTKLLTGYKVEFKTVTGEKATRAEGFASQVNVGNVLMLRAPWNKEVLDELRSFPNGVHDDIVDAGSDAFNDLMGSPDVLAMWKNLSK